MSSPPREQPPRKHLQVKSPPESIERFFQDALPENENLPFTSFSPDPLLPQKSGENTPEEKSFINAKNISSDDEDRPNPPFRKLKQSTSSPKHLERLDTIKQKPFIVIDEAPPLPIPTFIKLNQSTSSPKQLEHLDTEENAVVELGLRDSRKLKQKGKEVLSSMEILQVPGPPKEKGALQPPNDLSEETPLLSLPDPPSMQDESPSGSKRKAAEPEGALETAPPKKKPFVMDPTIAMLVKMLPNKPKLVEKTPEEKAKEAEADRLEELTWPVCEVKLTAENGTNGSLVHMVFLSPKLSPAPTGSRKVRFICKERDFEVQQDGIWVEDSKLQITFAISQRLSKERVVSFSIQVRGIRHNEVKYLWVNPATFGAATFLKKEGFPNILDSVKRDDLAEKLKSMTNKTRNSVVASYAVLGQVESIRILKDVYGVNICGVSPVTGENLFHIGLRENWPELATYAATFPDFFWQPDILGVTPHQLLEWLSPRHPSKDLLKLCPEKLQSSDDD